MRIMHSSLWSSLLPVQELPCFPLCIPNPKPVEEAAGLKYSS